jgi:MoxR-like ATPases
MHVEVDFPDADAERQILHLSRREASQSRPKDTMAEPVNQTAIFAAREEALSLHMAEPVETYIVQLTDATRNRSHYGSDLPRWLDFGVSPRATISLDRCARAHAWLNGKDYVSPEDVRAVIHDVYRHRLILSFEAEANGQTANKIVDELINRVPAV